MTKKLQADPKSRDRMKKKNNSNKKNVFKNRHNGESQWNDQIEDVIWLDPEIPVTPPPPRNPLTPVQANITQEKQKK